MICDAINYNIINYKLCDIYLKSKHYNLPNKINKISCDILFINKMIFPLNLNYLIIMKTQEIRKTNIQIIINRNINKKLKNLENITVSNVDKCDTNEIYFIKKYILNNIIIYSKKINNIEMFTNKMILNYHFPNTLNNLKLVPFREYETINLNCLNNLPSSINSISCVHKIITTNIINKNEQYKVICNKYIFLINSLQKLDISCHLIMLKHLPHKIDEINLKMSKKLSNFSKILLKIPKRITVVNYEGNTRYLNSLIIAYPNINFKN
jgi:hypothetical protein